MARVNPWSTKRPALQPIKRQFGPFTFTCRRLNGADVLTALEKSEALIAEWVTSGNPFPADPEFGPVEVTERICRMAGYLEVMQTDRHGEPLAPDEHYPFSDLVAIANHESYTSAWVGLVEWVNELTEPAPTDPGNSPSADT